MTCHACGAPLPGTARFCHKCGAAVAGALVTVLMLGVGESRERGAGPDGVPEGTAPRSPLPAPDISQMSPEEQARRLFDRVVGLAERGAQDSVRFFLPMALGAYAQLPALDLDARYDIGVLRLAGGGGAGAGRHDPPHGADAPLRLHAAGASLRARARRAPRAPRLRGLPALRDRRAGPPPPRVRRAPEHDRCLSRGGAPGHGRQVLVTLPPSPFPTPGLHAIRLAHSPDADDAFMFWAMTSGRIATGARRYVHELADIETLNRRALAGELECTAVSFHAYAHLADRYALLAHGASVGDRYGPRVVARAPRPADPRAALAGLTVAVPGELTTASLALRLYQPG